MMGTARFSSRTRRGLLAASAAAVSVGLFVVAASSYAQTTPTSDTTIRTFKIQIPQAALDDLRRRIAATRWPDKETVDDRSQGAQLAKLQELVQYWGSGYDWRKVDVRLNFLPQFTTNIDGVDILYIHVRSRRKNALPLIITQIRPLRRNPKGRSFANCAGDLPSIISSRKASVAATLGLFRGSLGVD